MLKKTITYLDYNEDEQTETLYFNLTKTEMMDLMDLQPRLAAWQSITDNPERALTIEENREMLSIMKTLIEKSYGVRSEDGKRFIKTPELFTEFTQTAAYDSFLVSLFENGGENAIEFMLGLLPKDLRQEAENEIRGTETVSLPQQEEDSRPAWVRENREPTQKELAGLSQKQLIEEFQRKNSARAN